MDYCKPNCRHPRITQARPVRVGFDLRDGVELVASVVVGLIVFIGLPFSVLVWAEVLR